MELSRWREQSKNLLDGLTIEELQEINKDVVRRIRALSKRRGLEEALKYEIGDTVSFRDKRGNLLTGRVERVNPKTLTIMVDGPVGERKWRVGYSFITKENVR